MNPRQISSFPVKAMLVVSALLAVSALTLTACGKSGEQLDAEKRMSAGGKAGQMAPGTERNFAVLINNYAQAMPAQVPWASYWWAFTANGIANGAHSGGQSPAGKFDAAHGWSSGHAQDWEVKFHGAGVKDIQGWWGHCNGWCAAAALYPEPTEPKKVNGITFGIAEQKALLAEAGMYANYDFYGNRAESRLFPNPQDLELASNDVVPDQYFLLLTNYTGKNHQPLLFDRYTTDQVWNQPLAGYKFEAPKPEDFIGADPANPNVYRINVTSTIWWVEDGVPAGATTPAFNWNESDPVFYSHRTLKAELWLDGPAVFDASGKLVSSGNVIVTRHPRNNTFVVGGQWMNGYLNSEQHPDYIWVPTSIPQITLEAGPLGEINEDANPWVDVEWITKYLLPGKDDPSAHPVPIPTAPSPRPAASGQPPTNGPTPVPTTPVPNPTTPIPVPTRPVPQPIPTFTSPAPGPGNPAPNPGNPTPPRRCHPWPFCN
ncbi:MAG: hypothetical protein H7222_16000 [Methylotenera sp.]|nr:hypothetical protein [Oligoflexia bacterium]